MEHDFPELSAYLDGELDQQARAAIEARLTNDKEYAEEYAALVRVRQGLQDGLPKADFHQQLMGRIEAERFTRPRRVRWAVPASLAAGILLVLGVAWVLGRPEPAQRVETGPAIKTLVASERPVENPRPTVESAAPKPELSEKADRFEATQLPLQLNGTVAGDNPSAVLTNTETGQQATYLPGDEVLPGVVLESVESGAVVLGRGDEQTVLMAGASGTSGETSTLSGVWQGTADFRTPESPSSPSAVTLRITESPGQVVVTNLDGLNARYVFEGGIVGTYLNLTLVEGPPDIPAGVLVTGQLNSDRTEVEMTSELDENRLLVLNLQRMADADAEALLAKSQTDEARKAEVEAMANALTVYAMVHDGAYPKELAQLISCAPGNDSLFASLPGRKVTYRANLVNPSTVVEPPPEWNASFMPGLSYPDRLIEYEKALRQHFGTPSPLAPPLLVVEYANPDTCLTVSTRGEVAAAALPEGLAELDESVLGALRATSQNNLKQLALVIKMFENEQGGYTPGGWLSVYPEYLTDTNVLHSPIDAPGKTSYELLFPATHVAEFALSTAQLSTNTGSLAQPMAETALPMIVETVEWPGAKPGRNVAFADGHVEYLSDGPYQERVVPYLKLR